MKKHKRKKKKPRPTIESDVEKAVRQAVEEFKKKFPGLLEELFETERKSK